MNERVASQPITSRHPALDFVFDWLEAGEDWVLPSDEADKILAPLEELIASEPVPPLLDKGASLHASEVMSAIRARRMMMIVDWIDANPENGLVDLFLENEDIPLSFRVRMRDLLLVLLRGKLLPLFFNESNRALLKEALERSESATHGKG